MATPYSKIIKPFLSLVEKEREFFKYFGLTDSQAMELAEQRSLSYMDEAIAHFALMCELEFDIFDKNDLEKTFNSDITEGEILIIASLMYERHLRRDFSKLKLMNRDYTSAELKVFDPTGARESFMRMYTQVCAENEVLLDAYRSKDRDTGRFKSVPYSAYDEE